MFSVAPIVQDHWDWRAAGNFIFGGTGSGLIVTLAFAMGPAGLAGPALIWALLIGLAFVGGGLFLVWLEIGKPWRFLNVFRNPFTSWMSREAYAAMVLFALALAAAGLVWLGRPQPVLVWLAALAGLVFLYCQARILHASRGIPAWRDGAVTPLIAATGLVEGISAMALILLVLQGVAGWLLWALLVALAARALAYDIYRRRLTDGRAPDAVVNRLKAINGTVWSLALVAPLALTIVALATTGTAPLLAALAAAAAALCAMWAGWYTKYNIVRRLAHMQGLAVRHMPVRGTGKAGAPAQPGWSARRQ